jgi:RND family efflux transporter MFP subunit
MSTRSGLFHAIINGLISGLFFISIIALFPVAIPADTPNLKTRETAVFSYQKTLRTTGRLKPNRQIILKSEISEEVTDLPLSEGDTVRKGRKLLQFDTSLLMARKRKAHHRMERARVQKNISQKNFQRKKPLLKKDLISESEYDQSKLEFQRARENYLIAKADYTEAKIRYSHTQLESPFSGILEEYLVEPGEQVRRGQGLITLLQIDPIKLHFEVTPEERYYLDKNDTVSLSFSSLYRSANSDEDTTPLVGQITTINHDVNPNGLYSVTARVANGQRKLVPGRTVSVELPLTTIPQAVEVPLTYLDRETNEPRVVLYDPQSDSIHKRAIKILDYRDESVVVPLEWDPAWKLVPGGLYTESPSNNE